MKRILSFIVAAMFAGQAWAQTTFEIGNLKYTVTDETNHYVSVGRGSTNPTGALEIPSTIKNGDVTYTVTSIDRSAFYNCKELTTVTISNSVTSIGNYAFYGCAKLTEINVESVNTAYSSEKGVLFNKDKTTIVCYPVGKKDATYTIPNSVTNIGSNAFDGCSGLTTVTIPNSVTSIGSKAFYGCSGLTSVTIPNSVTNIGEYAFYSCNSLTSATISNSVTIINGSTFKNCVKLRSVTMPSSVEYIGVEAFYSCSSLIIVDIPETVTKIGGSAFYGCSKLTSVTIPNSVTSIGNDAFYNCNSLTEVTIGNSVTSIGGSAFYGCSKLTSVTIPNSVTSIGNLAFYDCIKLATVAIGNSVETIGGNAFDGCSGLTEVTISNSVTSIGSYAFKNCSGLTSICYEGGSEPTYKSNSFTNVDNTIPVCVPEDYASNSWCGFSNLIKGHNKVTDNAVASTCTETGLTEGSHCSYCGKVLVAQEVIPTLDHTYSNTVTAPTCTAVGFTTHTCSVCEYTYNSDTVDAKGHKADSVEFENIIPATCTAAGSKDSVVFCSVCQVEISREERAIPALGHTEVVNEAVAPTCTKAGKTEGKYCSVCNTVIKLPIAISATGHKADSIVFKNVVAATCTAAGKTEGKHCSVCNAVLVAQEEIPALGHEFKTYTFDNNATTEADGTETATCERGCGATDTRTAAGTKIATTPEKGTAVSDAAANAISIYTQNNVIVVENAQEEISVYDAMGKLVCRDAIHRVRTEIPITAPGIYIVKTGNAVKRVMVN